MLPNASYFAFTATPKNKTLEIFGEPFDADGQTQAPAVPQLHDEAGHPGGLHPRRARRTTRRSTSYYKLVKTVEDDPEFDTKRAKKKLRRYVESHDHAIRLKAEIMVDHFHEQVLALNKIGGEARAMVVTSGIERAIQYFHAIRAYLRSARARTGPSSPSPASTSTAARRSPRRRSTASRASEIADKIQEDPYRFLVCADKFQTGYDEPLLHTMYVDKLLVGHQGGADALAAEPGAPEEARRLRARLHERRRHDPGGVRATTTARRS